MEKLATIDEISSFLFIQFPELDWKLSSHLNHPAMLLNIDKNNDIFIQATIVQDIVHCVGLTWTGHQQGSASAYDKWDDFTIALEQMLKRLIPEVNHQQVSIFSFIDDNER